MRTWWLVLARKKVEVEVPLGGLSESVGWTGYIGPDALTAHVFLHVVKLYISNLNLIMQIQKTSGLPKNVSLFSPNFKINTHSVRTIHRYLQHSSTDDPLQEKTLSIPSLSTVHSPVGRPVLSKNLIRTVSSELPESRDLNTSESLSRAQSLGQIARQDYLREIQRLHKQSQEQKTIIQLQQQLIKKLMGKLQGNNQPHNPIIKQPQVKEEEGDLDSLQKLNKVKELLQSSLRSL